MSVPTPAQRVDPSLPREVDGFRLLRELGRGGMGVVYHAEELSSGRAVALKVLAAELLVSEDAFERFRREARMAASISHSRCVFVYGAHQVAGAPAIAMELCPGETLEHRLTRGPLPIESAVRWTLEILEGLEAAHEAGVVHRDVKPSNCFITHDEHVKVGDFGLSRSLDTDVRLTQSGAFLGSPLYASPEQIKGREVDLRSDVYSCGATLYALLAGRPPYAGQNIGEVLARILSESPPSLRAGRTEVSAELERVVARAMEREPERRFQDHASFRAALEPLLASEALPAGRLQRAIAFLLDGWVISLLNTPITLLAVSQGWAELDPARPGVLESKGFILLLSALPAVYFALCEGLAGATLARWMFGQRVVDAGTRRVNLSRCLLRAFVFFCPNALLSWFLITGTLDSRAIGALAFAGSLVLYLFMASSMRRRNGFRGLHELASGTRVVQARSPFKRFQHARRVPVQEPVAAEGWPAAIGPYKVEGSIGPTPTGALLQCVDQSLKRTAWIYARRDGAGAATEERRSLARPGRLRWLESTRQGATLFEAFEAPGGTSFSACIASRAAFDWPTAQRVLTALADELAQLPGGAVAADARGDGDERPRVCLQQLWIDRTWSPRLLDEPIGTGRGTASFDFKPPLELLCDAARLMLGDPDRPHAVLPRGLPTSAEPVVRKLLGGGGRFTSMEEARRELRSLSDRPMSLSPRTRATQMIVGMSAPTVVVFLGLIVTLVTGTDPKDLVERQRCIRQLRAQDSAAATSEPMDDDDRRARELLISSAASGAWSSIFNGGLDPEELEICQRAAAAYPSPSAEDVAWARARIRAPAITAPRTDETAVVAPEGGPSTAHVEPERGGQLDDSPRETPGYAFGIPIIFAVTLGLWGAASTVLALILRGGLSLKLFGLGVRNRRGEMASRIRCAWRSLLVWAPLALLYGMAAWLARSVNSTASVTLIIATASLHAFAVVYAIKRPARGIQDRLAGTELVPR